MLAGRRAFLQLAAGTLGASLLGNRVLAAPSGRESLFASCVKLDDDRYAVAVLDEAGRIRVLHPLPDRGHDVAFDPSTGCCVAFARRPGSFAVVFDVGGRAEPTVLPAPPGRTFYGHGVFSADGAILYTTENDHAAGRGVLGIYDVRDGFRRVGEMASGGVGPHELIWAADGRTLVVANGGLDTDATFGRVNLNVADMDSSVALVDAKAGAVLAVERLGEGLASLSIRHLALDRTGAVWFGCQHEGDPTDLPPLAGRLVLGKPVELMELPAAIRARPRNYIGSVAASGDGGMVAFSAPKGGLVFAFSADGRFLGEARARDVCGLAPRPDGFAVTAGTGRVFSLDEDVALQPAGRSDLAYDNHLMRLG